MTKYLCYNWMGGFADHCLDLPHEFYVKAGVGQLHNKTLNPADVKEGDIVFVKTDFVYNGLFQQQVLPHIKNPFTLLTGISSYQVANGAPIDSIIDNPLVKKWYCTNAPVGRSAKIIPMPIGFEEQERSGGDQELLDAVRKTRTPFKDKSDKILLPYHTLNTNPARATLYDSLSKLPFVEVQKDKLPFFSYMQKLDKHKFVICLEGSGPDVHRNYEALLVDTVPINVDNIISAVFKHHSVPGEFIRSWDDLDENYYSRMLEKDYNDSCNNYFLQTKHHMEQINENRSI